MRSIFSIATVVVLFLACGAAIAAGPTGTVTIVEGTARFVRDSVKYPITAGVRLQDEDLIETDANGFLQIELADGISLGLGPATRVQLGPKLLKERVPRPDRLYVLGGWLKVSHPGKAPTYGYSTPGYDVMSQTGITVAFVSPSESRLFVESGDAKVLTRVRSGAAPTANLVANDFYVRVDPDKATVTKRPAPDFVEKMPRPFRDTLPPLAQKYADRPTAVKTIGPVEYDDVALWLKAEPSVRRQFLPRFRSRAQDAAFKAGLVANMKAHMEWDPVLFPEKYEPKDPPTKTTTVQPSAPRY